MSRIQEILKKAEQDGAMRRTRVPASAFGPQGTAVQATALATPAPLVEPEPPLRTQAAPREVAVALDGRLVAALAPRSLAAEQYRSLRTRIHQAEHGRSVRTLVVTSPGKGDGKSLTSANLALTMAQEFHTRVLLIDADLRRPAVHSLFGIAEAPGLTDVLMGGAALPEALVTVPEHNLTVLPAGLPPAHPAELLGSSAMRRLLDTLRTQYDRIILDMPPVEPLADVHIVAQIADALLLIVRAGQTERPAIERALTSLGNDKVLGLVLNEAGQPGAKTYEGYGYIAG